MKRFCLNCDKETEVKVETKRLQTIIDGRKIYYIGKIVKCAICGEEVYDSAISDENVEAANAAYRRVMELISVEDINRLLKKYNIGKKPLAQLLGWGESTLLRYFDGFTPRKMYSDQLKELFDPYKMMELFNRNRGNLTEVAGRKLLEEINKAIQKQAPQDKAYAVAVYFLSKIDVESDESITPLKLQKLVYYAQAWMAGLKGKLLFKESFQAWALGPVVPRLYDEFKQFSWHSLPKLSGVEENCFTPEEKEILDIVYEVYGKYDGKFLGALTHMEKPWIKARRGCKNGESCQNEISAKDIRDYYSKVSKKYSIRDAKGIEEYIRKLVNKR